MYQQLKSEIKEIIDIVDQCPASLKEKCFEVLLENFLSSTKKNDNIEENEKTGLSQDEQDNLNTNGQNETGQVHDCEEEILAKDFHVKTRKFLSDNKIEMKVINELYYKENGKLMPLYESVGSTKMSECQKRLALLTAFENSFSDGNGELFFNGEVVRQRCQDLKCYDGPHFANAFKRYGNLFDNWDEKYEKEINYTLSPDGKKELVMVLRGVAKGE